MPRNSSGQYFLPVGNPVISGDVIRSEWANTTMSDLAQSITDSLDRDGLGAMRAPLRLVDGTATKPAITFDSEGNSGFFRKASGILAAAIKGIEVFSFDGKNITLNNPPTLDNHAVNKAFVIENGGRVKSVNGKIGDVVLTYSDVQAAPLVSPALQGNPTAPTPAAGNVSKSLATTEFVNNAISSKGNFPTGGIIMWSGTAANVPTGWALCNGQNGTPNLQDKFIVAAGSKFSANSSGGSFTISQNQMPSHTHSGSAVAANTDHTHSLTTGSVTFTGMSTTAAGGHSHSVSDGGHAHTLNPSVVGGGNNVANNGPISVGSGTTSVSGSGIGIAAVGDHTHGISGNGKLAGNSAGMSANASHSHSVSITATGGGAEFIPTYFALCYIMKL